MKALLAQLDRVARSGDREQFRWTYAQVMFHWWPYPEEFWVSFGAREAFASLVEMEEKQWLESQEQPDAFQQWMSDISRGWKV